MFIVNMIRMSSNELFQKRDCLCVSSLRRVGVDSRFM